MTLTDNRPCHAVRPENEDPEAVPQGHHPLHDDVRAQKIKELEDRTDTQAAREHVDAAIGLLTGLRGPALAQVLLVRLGIDRHGVPVVVPEHIGRRHG